MNITLDEIQKNLKNNKIYLDMKCINVNHITYQNNYNIFNNISLKNLLNYKKKSIIPKTLTSKNNSNEYPHQLKYKKNTFINELINCLYERTLLDNPCIREFKEKFLNFVNSNETKEYLKKISRSYKKLQFKLNEILNVDNIDEHLNDFPELINVICKKFNFNILILSDNLYKLYKINDGHFLVFNKETLKYKDDYKKIYKFDNEYNNIMEIINCKNKYYDDKELNKLKIEDIKNIGKNFKIIYNKKGDIIKEINKICSDF